MMFRARKTRAALVAIAISTGVALVTSGYGTTPSRAYADNLAAVSRRFPASNRSAPSFVYAAFTAWSTSWSFNPYNPDWVGTLDDLSLLPLAIAKPPKLGNYIPELATSWKVTNNRVTITLRSDARWQDGKPVTSHDVLVSLELDGANGNGLWAETTGMTTPNAHTLVMAVRPGQSGGLLLYNVLSQFPVPASQYGKFLPSGFEHDLVSYYAKPASGAPSTTSPAGRVISAVETKLTKFVPIPFVGDGPYRELGITTSQMTLRLWPGYWDAKRIHVTNVTVDNFAVAAPAYALYYSHKIDFSNFAMLKNILDKWLKTSDHGYTTMPNYVQYGLDFNNRRYPFNQRAFRQAIAYIIDRPTVALAAYGGLHLAKADQYEDGVFYALETTWLTPAELKRLNAYPQNLAKAASLLKSLHFTKKNGKWVEPDGKPIRLTLTFQAGNPDSTEMGESCSSQLTNFGLTTTAVAVPAPGYSTEVPAGTFDIAWEFVGGCGLDPLADQASVIGTANNFPPVTSGGARTKAGLGFGPTMDVPGLGTVDVANTITREASTVGPGSKMAKLVWDWARIINRNLPYLVLANKVQQVDYSTYDYTDWPPTSNPDWGLMGVSLNGGLLVALQQGYIRPRS